MLNANTRLAISFNASLHLILKLFYMMFGKYF